VTARSAWARVPPWARDVGSAALFGLVDVALFSHVLNPDEAPAGSHVAGPLVVAYAALGFAALPLRKRFPLLVFAGLVLHSVAAWQLPLLGYHPTVGPLVALYTVAVLRSPVSSLLALLASALPASLVVADAVRLAPADKRTATLIANAVFLAVLGLAVWGVGRWVGASRRHARDLEARRAVAAREAVAAERRRLARELHDIVAHSVTVMVLQAGGAQQVLTVDSARAGEALDRIEELGKQAMAELRRLLVVLRASESDEDNGLEDNHQPGLDDLDDLIRTFRDATLPVRLEVRGQSGPLDRSVDLAAYRIVQEALTNVMKHAGPDTPTVVEVDWNRDLLILVTNKERGRPHRGVSTLATGHGLLGLRERVSVAGGTLDAGRTADGGFRVMASLPLPATTAGGRP